MESGQEVVALFQAAALALEVPVDGPWMPSGDGALGLAVLSAPRTHSYPESDTHSVVVPFEFSFVDTPVLIAIIV